MCYLVVIMHLFSLSLSIVLRCEGQLLNVIFSFLSARCIRWPYFALIRVSCRCVIDVVLLGIVCCTRLMRSQITVCSASSSACTRVQHSRAANSKYQSVERPDFKLECGPGSNVELPPYTVFDTGKLDGFKGAAVNRLLLP